MAYDTLLRLVRKAQHTRFGKDHDFTRISSVEEYQARVPVRSYEFFWDHYWKDCYPAVGNATWPGFVPYFALSSGTTSGTTKYIPVTYEMIASNKKAAFTTVGLFRHSFPNAKLFTGKFFCLGGSTDLRRQTDNSFAGDLSGIAAKELLGMLRPYTFPPLSLSLLTDWEEKADRFARDIQVTRVETPRSTLKGTSLAVDVVISQTGYAGQSVALQVEEDRKSTRLNSSHRT